MYVVSLSSAWNRKEGEITEQKASEAYSFTYGKRCFTWSFVLGMAFAEGSANDWLPIVMVDGHQQRVVTGSIMYTIFVLAMTLARMCSSYFLDRFGRVAVVRATIMMAIIGMTIVIFGSNSYFLALGVVLWGLVPR